MNRIARAFGALSLAVFAGVAYQGVAHAKEPVVTVVVKIDGIPWFSAFRKGVEHAGKDLNVDASMVGPATADPAQQVRLVDDLIAKKVDAIGLVPLDVKVMQPVLERAQQAHIPVITQEGPDQEGRTWDVALMDNIKYGEAGMQALAKAMGEQGEYIVTVGSLTTPLHNQWADAAIAYQKAHYPNMKLVADRYPTSDQSDIGYKIALDAMKAYPNLKGMLGEGANDTIGLGNAVREQNMASKIAVVGSVLPSQARSLLMDGTIREGFLWSPVDAGYAVVAVAKLVLDKTPITDGMTVPGLGPVKVNAAKRQITVDKMLHITKANVNDLMKAGL